MRNAGFENGGNHRRYQFRLVSLFVLTTAAALLSGLVRYVGGLVLLKQVIFILITLSLFLFVVVGPLLITEFLTYVIDTGLGLSSKSRMPGRRRFE